MHKSSVLAVTATLLAIASLPAHAADSYKDLAIFKSGAFNKGMWRAEMISSSDPRMMQATRMTGGGVGICMDAADDLMKNQGSGEEQCAMKPLKNTSSVAEMLMTCKDGSTVRSTMTRESDKIYLLDNEMKSAEGKVTTMKMRYTHEGACKNKDSVIQMDKNSEACKQMGGMDMSKMAGMCAKLPTEAKAQCEQQLKSMTGMCQ